ncbi:hypothetical protein Mgra_00003573 [Meloidogyne graminicola]|uniref:Uncharacterized protein n=1 Tax=Meloidogyne graminicola TaxID=189291 RepID=A0A8S9ZUT6_9BILA|nr:hypothetical protein Mgra_00003573 [Meloidogyne graminicola]
MIKMSNLLLFSASNRPTNLHPTGPISSSSDKDVSISSGSGTSTTATSRVNLSEGTGTIMFLPVNSQFGNIFPDPVKEFFYRTREVSGIN